MASAERIILYAGRIETTAILSDGTHRVSFDRVVKTMRDTGHDLPSLYRETSTGGLAVNVRLPSTKES